MLLVLLTKLMPFRFRNHAVSARHLGRWLRIPKAMQLDGRHFARIRPTGNDVFTCLCRSKGADARRSVIASFGAGQTPQTTSPTSGQSVQATAANATYFRSATTSRHGKEEAERIQEGTATRTSSCGDKNQRRQLRLCLHPQVRHRYEPPIERERVWNVARCSGWHTYFDSETTDDVHENAEDFGGLRVQPGRAGRRRKHSGQSGRIHPHRWVPLHQIRRHQTDEIRQRGISTTRQLVTAMMCLKRMRVKHWYMWWVYTDIQDLRCNYVWTRMRRIPCV